MSDFFTDDLVRLEAEIIKIKGEVSEILTERSFLLSHDKADKEQSIIVIYDPNDIFNGAIMEASQAIIQGQLVRLTPKQIQSFLGPGLDPQILKNSGDQKLAIMTTEIAKSRQF